MLALLNWLDFWIGVLRDCFALRAEILDELDMAEAERAGATWYWPESKHL